MHCTALKLYNKALWTANLETVCIVCKQLHNGYLQWPVHGFTTSWICSPLRVVQMCTLYACTSLPPPLGARGHSVSLLALTIHIPAIHILTTLCKSIICNNYSLIYLYPLHEESCILWLCVHVEWDDITAYIRRKVYVQRHNKTVEYGAQN